MGKVWRGKNCSLGVEETYQWRIFNRSRWLATATFWTQIKLSEGDNSPDSAPETEAVAPRANSHRNCDTMGRSCPTSTPLGRTGMRASSEVDWSATSSCPPHNAMSPRSSYSHTSAGPTASWTSTTRRSFGPTPVILWASREALTTELLSATQLVSPEAMTDTGISTEFSVQCANISSLTKTVAENPLLTKQLNWSYYYREIVITRKTMENILWKKITNISYVGV